MTRFKQGDLVYNSLRGLCIISEVNIANPKFSYFGNEKDDLFYKVTWLNNDRNSDVAESKLRHASDEDIVNELTRELTTVRLEDKTLFLNDNDIFICQEDESISLTREDLKKILELVNV